MFLINSRLSLFAAAYHEDRRPLFRSYGANLPSSFTRVLSSTLGYSPHLPVSDCGTGDYKLSLEAFPGSIATTTSFVRRRRSYSPFRLTENRIYLIPHPTGLNLEPTPGWFHFLRHHIALIIGTGILNLFSIAYACSAST